MINGFDIDGGEIDGLGASWEFISPIPSCTWKVPGDLSPLVILIDTRAIQPEPMVAYHIPYDRRTLAVVTDPRRLS